MSDAMKMDASFIIPTWKRHDALQHSIPRFLGQTCPETRFEIIVVSDGPDSESKNFLEGIASESITYSSFFENLGRAAARNRAIELANGEILVFVDDDSLVEPDFLETHLSLHAENPNRIVTGPIIDIEKVTDAGRRSQFKFLHRHLNPFPTCNASIRKQTVIDAGAFNESFTGYGWEDAECYERISRLNPERVFCQDVPIYHFKPDTKEQSFASALRRELDRGRNGKLFHQLHPNFQVAMMTKRIPIYRWIDQALNKALNLDEKLNAALETDEEELGALTRTILLKHAEIYGGK